MGYENYSSQASGHAPLTASYLLDVAAELAVIGGWLAAGGGVD